MSEINRKYLRRRDLCAAYGMSESTLDRRIAHEGFPRALKILGRGMPLFVVAEVDEWFATNLQRT